MKNRFEEKYQQGDMPWDHDSVDHNLIDTVSLHSIQPCRALDIGCGTGNNAIWLAEQGFDVTACDFSETAIKLAKEKAGDTSVQFLTADFLTDTIPNAPFGLIFDRGCLHTMDSEDDKQTFAKIVATKLDDDGLWLSLIGNADEPPREIGPPRMTATEITRIVEPYFEILSLNAGLFGGHQEDPPRAWICLLKKRSA